MPNIKNILTWSKPMIEYYACTRQGLGRDRNMDRIFVDNNIISSDFYGETHDNTLWAVVCDGVGSMKNGDLAAEIVASSFSEIEEEKVSPVVISRHIHKINREICMLQKTDPSYDMATTVAGIAVVNNSFLSFNLGDTRIYSFHGGEITRLTKDHVLDAGNDYNNGARIKRNHTLTSYIGGNGNACFPSLRRGTLNGSDVILMICTDGVFDNIDEEILQKYVSGNKSLSEKARAILELSLQNGSKDDQSIVLIRRKNETAA